MRGAVEFRLIVFQAKKAVRLMKDTLLRIFVITIIINLLTECVASSVTNPAFLDPGFESYSVPNGSFRRRTSPDDPPWYFLQNSFVVDPTLTPQYEGSAFTRAGTYAAYEGEQYISSYAGNGGIRQYLTFTQPGDYRLSVHAASPAGNLFIQTPVVSGTFPLVSGEFQFRVDNQRVGPVHTAAAGAAWRQFETIVSVTNPGQHWVGVDNTKGAVYFIYYDSFSIEPVVPEPSALMLCSIGFGINASMARRRRNARASR